MQRGRGEGLDWWGSGEEQAGMVDDSPFVGAPPSPSGQVSKMMTAALKVLISSPLLVLDAAVLLKNDTENRFRVPE